MKIKYILLIACASLMLLSGCASKKKAAAAQRRARISVVSPETAQQPAEEAVAATPVVVAPVTEKVSEPKRPAKPVVKTKTVVEKALEAQPSFQSVSAPRAKCQLTFQQRQIASSASITMIKDSILIISVQPLLGIELLRVEATPHEIMVLDKMNKRYVLMNYEEATKELGMTITFADIQAIAMDHLFVLGQDEAFIAGQEHITSANGKSTLHVEEGKMIYDFRIDESSLLLEQTKLAMTGNKGQATIDYVNHTSSNGVLFPSTIKIAFQSGKNELSAKIDLPGINFNTITNATRANLRSYQKTTISAILSGK